MRLRRINLVLCFVLGAGAFAEPAQAQFGDLQRMLFRGSQYVGNRNYISNPQGGPLFDNNIYDQRLEWNRVGQGYTFESFRFFGPDSFDNPNTVDLGGFKIQLGRDPAVVGSPQPLGVHNKIGYTTSFVPEVFFESQTGQRNFDIFSGQTSFVPVPINYIVTMDAGAQKFEWTGNMLVDAQGRVNALGFYDFQLQLTNVGNYTADGFVVHDEQVTDFDTGPIDVSGHILMDALAGLAQIDGSPDQATTPRIVSAATSNKGKTVDELMASLQAGEKLSDDDMSFLLRQMFETAFLNDPIGFMQNGMPSTVPGFEALTLAVSEDQSGAEAAAEQIAAVPEPGTLLLIAGIAGLFSVLQPRWRHRPCY